MRDVIAVLPTGYGKSLLFQVLLDVLLSSGSDCKNTIIVVSTALNSIIEDQMKKALGSVWDFVLCT